MNRHLFILFILIQFIPNLIIAQKQTKETLYSVEFNEFYTSSGFAAGSEIYFTVIPDSKKSISLGLYYCPESKSITGITIHHERYLKTAFKLKSNRINPYAFYNLIYRRTKMTELLPGNMESDKKVTYKSMEHHIGMGTQIYLRKNVFVKGELGYGLYIGSIKKASGPDPITGEIYGKTGFGFISKIGIGFIF